LAFAENWLKIGLLLKDDEGVFLCIQIIYPCSKVNLSHFLLKTYTIEIETGKRGRIKSNIKV